MTTICITCSQRLDLVRVGRTSNCRWCGQEYEVHFDLELYQPPLSRPEKKRYTPLPVIPSDFPTHDNTMLSAFNKCPRLYEILYIRKRRPGMGSPALDFGSLMHAMLATWYDHMVNGKEKAEQALYAALEVGLKANYYEHSEDFRTRERALMMMAEYAQWYGYMEKRYGWEIIFAETGFDVMMDRFPYGGKIDLLIRWNGKLYIVDHKTTSRFGDDYFLQYVPDTQTCGYVASGEKLHGQPIEGVFMNVLIVHKVKKPLDQQFQRRAFQYPRWMIEEWDEQVLHGYNEIKMAREMNYFRPRWQSCADSKFGKCAAFYLCRSDPKNRDKILETDWIEYEWDWKKIEVPTQKDADGPILIMD